MSDIWDTKDGRRRVRHDPPTVEEAVQAAQGLTDELSEQIEIVASLMDVIGRSPRHLTNNIECAGPVVGPRHNFDDRYAQGEGGASAGRGRVGVR